MSIMDTGSASDGSNSDKAEYDGKVRKLEHTNTANTLVQPEFDEKGNRIPEMEPVTTQLTSFDAENYGKLYDPDGQLVLIPAATKDPRDPMNMTTSRKVVALVFLCCYGAFAAAAELILGAMLPIFVLQYAGYDPKIILIFTRIDGGLPEGQDPLAFLAGLPHAPPLIHIYLLASLPILVIGLTNLIFIPLAIAVGRRSVIIACGLIAIAGCLWAGFSQSLASHLLARCLQAFGAGTVESLIPFIISDICHVHQRNVYISSIFAAQGIIIIAIGVAAPYLIINLNWRWVYYITAIGAGFFLVGVVAFLPETRWNRTRAEMNGIPKLDARAHYEPRTWKYDLALFHGTKDWKKGKAALINTLRTFFYPHIFFITMLNSVMIACALAAGYTVSPALLTKPWSWDFMHLGLCLIPVLVGAICVGLITGSFADAVVNYMAKRSGRRLPEYQLLNLVVPTLTALIGTVLFGLAGQSQKDYPWIMFVIGLGCMAFGFLGANTVGAVYVIECYPQLAGPALVNIASFRCLIAFALSFGISDWILDLGYLRAMMIYTGLIAFFALMIPVVYVFGPAWRKRWPATQYEF